MRRALVLVALVATLTACSTTPTAAPADYGQTPAPSATPAAEDTSAASSTGYALTDQQQRFVTAVRKNLPANVKDATDWEMVQLGRDFCGMGYDKETIYDAHGGNPPNVEGIAQNKDMLGTLEKNAVIYLCPRFARVWRQGMAAFDDGEHVVGEDLRPGRYRTLGRKVKGCYWERTAQGGKTLANDFVNFAPSGVTVTILPSDGGFTSTRCGLWIPA